MRIGEIADQTGVSVRAIRYYEQAGLLPATRESNGYRDFHPDAVERVRAIRHLLETGFTIDEVVSLASCLGSPAPDARCSAQTAAIYRDKLVRIDAQLDTLTRLRHRIEAQIATLTPD